VRNNTIGSLHTVRASGFAPISLAKAMTCQQFRIHMADSRLPGGL
jgi:hypothetical protein